MPVVAAKKKQDIDPIPLIGQVVGTMYGGPAGGAIGGSIGQMVSSEDDSGAGMVEGGTDIMAAMKRRKGKAGEQTPEKDVAAAYQQADAMGPEGDKYKPTLAQALAKAEREKATQQTSMYEYE